MLIVNLYEAITYNHFIISGFLVCILYFLYYKIKTPQKLYNLLTVLLTLNFLTFNLYLLSTSTFNYKIHLPLHLCYLTELSILVSIIFKSQIFYPWLALNALGGGITGFTNSNLLEDSMLIEHIHLYLSHFNLLLFSIIVYLNKLVISKSDLIKSSIFNASIFFGVIYFNFFFGSNYWFTSHRPSGSNLTNFLPDWPYYLLVLISIGLISYYVTFKLFLKNRQ